eukprot:206487-Ditylum_brightwellii.AAC.1
MLGRRRRHRHRCGRGCGCEREQANIGGDSLLGRQHAATAASEIGEQQLALYAKITANERQLIELQNTMQEHNHSIDRRL